MKSILSFFSLRPNTTRVLAIAWTLIIFIGCSMPGKDLPKIGLFDHFDKVVHFSFFLGFFLLWFLSFPPSIKTTLLIFLISALYGFGIEFYQLHFVAGRSFDVWDGIADSLGAAIGWLCIRVFNRQK